MSTERTHPRYPIEEDVDYTIPLHGEGRGLPGIMVEIRQDGIRTAAGWAARLAEAYQLIEEEAVRFFGSWSISSASGQS